MIAVDWGTSSFRAALLRDGVVIERRDSADGILQLAPDAFAPTLRRAVGPWLAQGERRILMSGMIGSRQGWREAPYLDCPAGAAELAAALTEIPFAEAELRVVPGLRGHDAQGVPEVMRGEETQLVGALAELGAEATVCLPGSHSKWATIAAGRIAGFTTHMTGEAFAALGGHTILARTVRPGASDPEAFRRGVRRAGQAGGLLHHLFGVRSLALTGGLAEVEAGSYLSGLLIGHEIAAASPAGTVHLIGAAALCQLYASALAATGRTARILAADAALTGLATIAEHAQWS